MKDCKTCNNSRAVWTVAYMRTTVPLSLTEGTDSTPTSFSIEQVKINCPDCCKLITQPAPAIGNIVEPKE